MSSPRKALTAIAGSHLIVECYAALLIPLVPVFRTRLGFSLGVATALGASLSIVSGIVSMFFGILSDRIGRPNVFICLSSLLGAAAIALIAVPRQFGGLLVIFAAIALASAMFHPPGAADTSLLSSTNRGRFMSIFNVGGSIGTFLGSLIAVPLYQLVGLRNFWLLALPVLLFALFQRRALPKAVSHGMVQEQEDCGPLYRDPHLIPYLTLVADGILTATVSSGITVLLPLLFQELRFDPRKAGVYLGVFSLAGAVANLIGAELSDHLGRKFANVIGAAGVAVSMLLFVLTGCTSIVWSTAVGFFCSFTLSSNVVFAHELITGHHGFVASSIMGVTWGVGGLLVVLLGHVAQRTGLLPVFHVLFIVTTLTMILALLLPSSRSLNTTRSAG